MNIETFIEKSMNMNPNIIDIKTVPDVAIRVYFFEDGVLETRQCRLSTKTISERFFLNCEEVAWCYRDLARNSAK
jgi:hypothetical protein